jgi:hypothetical protein
MVAGITRADVRSAGLWFAGALALYVATGARGLVWADSSKLTLYALSGYFPSLNPGDHAGWTVLAWAWLRLVGGDPVIAAHRLSAVFGALAVALAMLVIVARTGDRERAHTTAALLLVALPMWWAATVAETYPVALALSLGGGVALLSLGRGWRWFGAGVLWGLALACHAMAIFLIVPLAWEAGGRRAWRLLPGAVVGSAPVWLAINGGGPPDPLTSFAASGGSTWSWHWEAFVAFARAPRGLAVLAAIVLYGFGVMGIAALWRGRRDARGGPAWGMSLGALALLLATYAPYRLHLMAIFLVVGALVALPVRLGAVARGAAVAVQALVFLAVPAVLTIAGRQDLGVRVLPFRNNAFYFLCPLKGLPDATGGWGPAALLDPGTERYVAALGTCAPPDATIVADFNPGAPLRLAQVARGWRRDLEIRPVAVDVALGAADPAGALAGEIGRALERGPVMLADTYRPYYRLDELAARFRFVPCRVGALVRAGGGGR